MGRLADVIRSFVEEQYVIPARANKTARFTIRAGDVHAAMRLTSRMPAVCSVLESASFLRKNGLKLVERRGPRQGANVYFAYELPNDPTATDAPVMENADYWNPQTEWFWEGNIQNMIVEFLRSSGYKVLRTADTGTKEQGPDIVAEDGRKHVVSVKGYPSERYTFDSIRGKKGEVKRSAPSTQARHWFSDALFDSLLTKSEKPDTEVALGLPDVSTYRKLLDRISWTRHQLGISCYLVNAKGRVRMLSPDQEV